MGAHLKKDEEQDVLASGDYNFDIDAGWELRGKPDDEDDPERAICRWCYIYQFVDSDENDDLQRIAGVAAGYAGGGSFQVQKFYLESANLVDVTKLSVVRDVGGELDTPEEWYELDSKVQDMAHEARNVLLDKWADEGAWIGSDELLLREEMWSHDQLTKQDDMLYACTDDDDPWTKALRESLGLTAGRVFVDG